MSHLAATARAAPVRELAADVLSDNAPMLKVFENSGLPLSTKRQAGILHVTLQLS
jgi:hypothetical protein